MKLSVVIPARNESGNVKPVLFKTQNALKKSKLKGEIIFVDDGSTDSTRAEAKGLSIDILRMFHHSTPLGLSEAMNTGIKNTTGDFIIFLPCDLQSNPEEDIPKLLEKLNQGFDVVVGKRKNHTGLKFLDSTVYNLILRTLFRLKTSDNNWIKGFHRKPINNVVLKSGQHRLLVPILASRTKSITEVEVNYYPRIHGKSKFGLKRIPETLWALLDTKLHH